MTQTSPIKSQPRDMNLHAHHNLYYTFLSHIYCQYETSVMGLEAAGVVHGVVLRGGVDNTANIPYIFHYFPDSVAVAF